MRHKNRLKAYNAGIATVLAIAVAASLLLSSPLPAGAYSISVSVADSSVSGNTTYLLGERITIPANIRFLAGESKDLQSASVNITGVNRLSLFKELPITVGTYQYSDVPGSLDVTVNWGQGVGAYGLGYGYGYSTGSGNITYDIKWTPPYELPEELKPTPPPMALPGVEHHFDIFTPSGSSAYADQPQGLAYDGSNLYILLHADFSSPPTDIIMKTDTSGATVVDWFPAPGSSWNTAAITLVGSTLYAAYNEWDSTNWMDRGRIEKYVSGSWTSIPGLSNLDPIGGLASDGTNLFIAYRDQLRIDKRDPTTGFEITSFDLSTAWGGGMGPDPMGPPIWGFDALAYDSVDEKLYAGRFDCIIEVDANTGDKTPMDYFINQWDIRGLTLVSETFGGTAYNILYIATQWQGKVYRASKPGVMPDVLVENTPTGDYTATFRVITTDSDDSETTSFTLAKLTTAPEVTISTPSSGFAKGTGAENITVAGSINDPSISSVTVGIALPTVTAFEDDAENESQTQANWEHLNIGGMMQWGPPYSQQDLWHRSDQRDHTGDTGWSWRYGVEGQEHFNTPMMANAGILRTTDNITIGADNTLTFWTWYDTEMDFWMDRKMVEVSTDGANWQPIAWLAQFWPPFPPPDISQENWDTLTMVSPWSWTKVEVSLAEYAGEDIYIRFRFDSMDDWGNEGQGWFIDDISISGAGFQGETVSVASDLSFSTQFTLAEGSNTISVTAKRTSYEPQLTGTDEVTGSLDTAAPVVVLDEVTTPSNQNTQVLTGTVTEMNFDRLTMKVNGAEQYSTTVLTENTTGVGTFVCTATLSSGTNNILVSVTDDVGLSATDNASIVYDAVGPVFESAFSSAQYDVAYKTGAVSARPGDWFFICLKVTDNATSVATVKLVVPDRQQSQWPSGKKLSEIPGAVIDSWGITAATKAAMNYVIPMQLPSGTPAGDYSWTVKAWDTAGNMAQLTPVATTVVTTLEAFNIYLMPDWNLVSSPLVPTTDNITTLTTSINATGLFEKVWYYDASKAGTADEWVLYEPGVGSDLTTIEAGKGYWVKMKDLAAFTSAGKVSDPMASGLPNTPVPVKLTIAGQVLQPGAVVPPTYTVYQGWNLIGLHSELERPVSTALGSVTVPQQVWGSLLQYLNYISYPMGQEGGTPEIDLGRFDRLVSTDGMQPGRGFWLYMVQDGVIVP